MILVTTAGKVGLEAARVLAARHQPVRLLTRRPGAFTDLATAGVDVVHGDLDAPATIATALRDITSVLLVTAAVPEHEINVIHGAVRAGVTHVTKVTAKSGADSPIRRRRDQARIEAELIASGLDHTLLRNNFYMQNFLMMAPTVARTGGFAMATGSGRVGYVDARDVAAIAAGIAAAPGRHTGRTYWPTGPQALSGSDVAATLTTVLGREIGYRPITFEQQKQAMLTLGAPEPVADDNARALALAADGDGDYLTQDVPTLLGRPARTFEEFVIDHRAAFTAGRPG